MPNRQLHLFDPAPPPRAEVPELPDLGRLFEELNARFFDGQLVARCEWSNRLTASAGNCRPKERLIRVSVGYHRRRPDALPVTLAHEMLHLLIPGHGAEFKRAGVPIAEALGTTWKKFRYAEAWADLRRFRYLYACRSCGLEIPSMKRRRGSCGRCGPGGYSEEYRLVLAESRARPGPVLLGERPVRVHGEGRVNR